MPVPAVRTIVPENVRNFGRFGDTVEVPPLTDIQTKSYDRFLQLDTPPEEAHAYRPGRRVARNLPHRELRQDALAAVHQLRAGQAALRPRRVPAAAPDLRPALPRLAAPRQGPARRGGSLPRRHADHDRRRRVHHQRRRARRRQPAAPLARRRFRHRHPNGDRKLHCCRIIPERGSWIEVNVTKKETLGVRIDQSGKFSAMTLLRAMDPAYSTDADILRAFYPTETVKIDGRRARERLTGRQAVGDVIDPETGEVYLDSGEHVHAGEARRPSDHAGQGSDGAVARSRTRSSSPRSRKTRPARTKRRCSKIYQRLRPGNPPQLEKAKRAVQGEVPGSQPLPPGQGRPFPHQPQVRPGHPRVGNDAAGARLPQRDPLCHQTARPRGQGDDRRHRPPRQSPGAHHRRAGRRRAAQGLPQAAPHRAGAHVASAISRT